jgi:hypothetical protein
MTPDEKELLMRTLKLSEDNNHILVSLQKTMRWQTIWGLIKVLLIVIPLVIGYLYLQPYFGTISNELKNLPEGFKNVQNLINSSSGF